MRAAFDLVLRRKALGAEALAAQRDAVLGGRYPHLRGRLAELTALKVQIARVTVAGPEAGAVEAYRQRLAALTAERRRREVALAGEIPEVRIGRSLQAARRGAVAGALPDRSALVEWVRFEAFDFDAVPARGGRSWRPARYVAFVLLAGKPADVRMIDLGEADPVDDLVADYRDRIAVHPADRPVLTAEAGAPPSTTAAGRSRAWRGRSARPSSTRSSARWGAGRGCSWPRTGT